MADSNSIQFKDVPDAVDFIDSNNTKKYVKIMPREINGKIINAVEKYGPEYLFFQDEYYVICNPEENLKDDDCEMDIKKSVNIICAAIKEMVELGKQINSTLEKFSKLKKDFVNQYGNIDVN